MKTIFLLVAMFVIVVPSAAQRHIEFDGLNVRRRVKVPKPILQLLHDELQRNPNLPLMCRGDKLTDVSSWFSASRIDLAERPLAYLVTPEKECLTPVDHTRFWIARKTPQGYRLVLQAGAVVLDARKTRTHGLRDLETNGATAATNYTAIYKFDGHTYKYSRCFQASPPDAKRKRVPCERN